MSLFDSFDFKKVESKKPRKKKIPSRGNSLETKEKKSQNEKENKEKRAQDDVEKGLAKEENPKEVRPPTGLEVEEMERRGSIAIKTKLRPNGMYDAFSIHSNDIPPNPV